MSKYTSSPLGIIDNVNGFEYGQNDKESIFTSYKDGTKKQILYKVSSTTNSNTTAKSPILGQSPHSNEIYDVSTTNIIEKLESIPLAKLNYSDFAYLKDLGVYPNNRLIIARRFQNPVVDDIYSLDSKFSPISTVIGWVPEGSNFITLSFQEQWTQADVSFKTLLNELGNDFGMSGQFQIGDILEEGFKSIPMPGATLLLQRRVMKALGVIDDVDAAVIPQGDPNLIKQARVRRLIGENEKGTGLTGNITI